MSVGASFYTNRAATFFVSKWVLVSVRPDLVSYATHLATFSGLTVVVDHYDVDVALLRA